MMANWYISLSAPPAPEAATLQKQMKKNNTTKYSRQAMPNSNLSHVYPEAETMA